MIECKCPLCLYVFCRFLGDLMDLPMDLPMKVEAAQQGGHAPTKPGHWLRSILIAGDGLVIHFDNF